MTDRYDDTLDRLAESLSMGMINMRALAVVDPSGYLECRAIASQLRAPLEKIVAAIEPILAEARAMGLCK